MDSARMKLIAEVAEYWVRPSRPEPPEAVPLLTDLRRRVVSPLTRVDPPWSESFVEHRPTIIDAEGI
jgi:hypothetical protein